MRKRYVRSAEPLIPPIFTPEEILFYKWVGGFVDGDGYFSFYEKKNRTALEISQATWNLHLLEQLKEKFGGSLKKRNKDKKSNTYLYNLVKKDNLIQLLHGVNGYIRTTSRTVQYKKLCDFYNIIYIEPDALMKPCDPYFSGMFDADGSVFLDNENGKGWKLRLSMTSKYNEDIQKYKEIFGGTINPKSEESYYEWRVSSEENVMLAQKHFVVGLRSNKLIRCKLIPLFFELRSKRAYLPDSPLYKNWQQFVEDWYNNGADIYRKDCTGRPYTKEARQLRALENDLDE